MAVDKKLESELNNQIALLEKLKTRLGQAIERARESLGKVQSGQSREEVFPPKA